MKVSNRRPRRKRSGVLARAGGLFCLMAVCVFPAVSIQVPDSGKLKIHRDDGTIQEYETYPKTAATMLFPGGDAILDRDAAPEGWPNLSVSLVRKVQFVRVSDARRRFKIAGVVYGDRLFVFDELLCGENPAVMNELVHVTATTPQSAEEALALAKLYVSLSYYTLEDPGRFLASKIGDIPAKRSHMPGESVDDIRDVLHSPRATSDGSGYKVELFATDVGMARVHRWQMDIGVAGFQGVTNQVIYPNFKSTVGLFAHHQSDPAQGNGEKIELKLVIMANGSTPDGAMTDIQQWVASNGPGVTRTHYYYESPANADALMQKLLQDAIAVFETGPWLDSEGKVAGKRAVVILANADAKALYAARLFEDHSSVLNIACSCLSNLSAIGK
jgi:hypothetical protein